MKKPWPTPVLTQLVNQLGMIVSQMEEVKEHNIAFAKSNAYVGASNDDLEESPLVMTDSRILDSILAKLTTIGALYLTLVCLMPEFLIAKYPIPFYLGGTSILIVVVVAIDTVTQVQTRLMSSQYEELIKKTKFGR